MSGHLESDLIAYLRDELDPAARTRVETHLTACDDCRATHAAFARLLDGLAATRPPAPAVAAGRYAAEVRARRDARHRAHGSWRERLVPSALAGAFALALLALALGGPPAGDRGREAVGPEPTVAGEAIAVARGLDLLQSYPVIERLDLLENLDVIGDLDRLPATDEG